MPACRRQWYEYAPGLSNVRSNRSPGATSPESNVSSSAVTVWRRSLIFVHSTVSPGSTSSGVGENHWNWMFTGSTAEAGAAGATRSAARAPASRAVIGA
jgi:hypothetical protein